MAPSFVEPAELALVAEQLTGSAEPGEWEEEAIGNEPPVASATRGLCRVRTSSWSVVVKLIGHGTGGHPNWQSGQDVEHWYYWRREALAYGVGLMGSFRGGLRGPVCHLAAERADGTIALWLEDAATLPAAVTWPSPHYAVAARHLGRAQGDFVVGRPLPDAPWLSRNWLRSYLAPRDGDLDLLGDDDVWDQPLVRRHLPRSIAGPLLELRDRQPQLLEALDRLPPTVCHLDLHPANLFGDDQQTVAVDWSFVGIGAMGEDAGNLVADAALDFHVAPSELPLLFEVVRKGYAAGLADAGWPGPPYLVDLAMSAAVAAKFAWIGPAMLRGAIDHRTLLNHRPIEETFVSWGAILPFLLWCNERVEQLSRLAPPG